MSTINEERDNAQAVQHLLRAAMIVSPTGIEQQGFTYTLQEMQASGEPSESIIVSLAGAMIDGLLHGNWPTRP